MRKVLFIYQSPETIGAEVTFVHGVWSPPAAVIGRKCKGGKAVTTKEPAAPESDANVNFVICITDASWVDRQIVVSVAETTNLGRAAHLALDQIMDEGTNIQFPVFLDIHSADEFSNVAWMHGQ